MKKYVFILAALLLFIAATHAEARAVKLGRSTLGVQNNLNGVATGGDITPDPPGPEMGQCAPSECRSPETNQCISMTLYACSGEGRSLQKGSDGYCECVCQTYYRPVGTSCVHYCAGVHCAAGYYRHATSNGCCCTSDPSSAYMPNQQQQN